MEEAGLVPRTDRPLWRPAYIVVLGAERAGRAHACEGEAHEDPAE